MDCSPFVGKSTLLALLFHVLNDARNSILADYRDNVITFLHLIRILSRRRHAKADFFSSGVLYGVVPSLNVCQLSVTRFTGVSDAGDPLVDPDPPFWSAASATVPDASANAINKSNPSLFMFIASLLIKNPLIARQVWPRLHAENTSLNPNLSDSSNSGNIIVTASPPMMCILLMLGFRSRAIRCSPCHAQMVG